MYCTKCGKKANPGDRFCGGCGSPLGKQVPVDMEKPKSGSGRLLVLILVAALAVAFFVGREDARQKELQEQAQWGQIAAESTEAAPEVENIYNSDGKLFKTIQYHGNGNVCYVEQRNSDGYVCRTESYFENGEPQVFIDYYYSGEKLEYLDIYTYDEKGSITSYSGQYGDGTVYNCYYYSYKYDDLGRMVEMTNFNQNGVLMQEEHRTYHADGGYTRDYTEYRGANTYDWEFDMDDPDVAVKWYHAIIECDAQGHELSVDCDFSDGYPQED